jgi:hypothetical protein
VVGLTGRQLTLWRSVPRSGEVKKGEIDRAWGRLCPIRLCFGGLLFMVLVIIYDDPRFLPSLLDKFELLLLGELTTGLTAGIMTDHEPFQLKIRPAVSCIKLVR